MSRSLAGLALACIALAPASPALAQQRPIPDPIGLAVGAGGNMYVATSGDSSVRVFTRGGRALPLRRIGGPRSGLVSPQGVALDSRGRLYVSSGVHRTDGRGSITVYAPGATGDVAPLRRIQGEPTRLAQPRRIAVGPDGMVYVVNGGSAILAFDPGARGSVEPRVMLPFDSRIPPTDVGLTADGTLLTIDGGGFTIHRESGPIRLPLVTRLDSTLPSTAKRWPLSRRLQAPWTHQLFALGPAGELYVAETIPQKREGDTLPRSVVFGDSRAVVSVYPHALRGDSTRARRIVGPRERFAPITDVAVGGDGSLYLLTRNRIQVYSPGADGEAPPVRTITGKRTGLTHPTGLAIDRNGRLYVTNDGPRDRNGVPVGTVLVFAPDAAGDSPPIDTIGGPTTGLSRPNNVAVAGDGTIYVANGEVSWDDFGSVRVFAAGAGWNEPPLRAILGASAAFVNPAGLALDPADTLYVVGRADGIVGGARVTVYPPGAQGSATPVRILRGEATGLQTPRALALDRQGRLYVSDQREANHANVYGADRGAVLVYRKGAGGDEAPVRTITGSYTRLNAPGAIALDREGNVYVPNMSGTGPGSVTVYGPADSGDVRPRRMIAGAATGLDLPSAVWLDRHDTLYVQNSRTVTVYPPGARGDARPVRTTASLAN